MHNEIQELYILYVTVIRLFNNFGEQFLIKNLSLHQNYVKELCYITSYEAHWPFFRRSVKILPRAVIVHLSEQARNSIDLVLVICLIIALELDL
jgi:hypothetical protein